MPDDIVDAHLEGFPHEREERKRRLLEALHAQLVRTEASMEQTMQRIALLAAGPTPPTHPSDAAAAPTD